MRFVAWGEKTTPARREITGLDVRVHFGREVNMLTSFRKVVLFLEQVRHQSVDGNESSKSSTYYIETDNRQCRHFLLANTADIRRVCERRAYKLLGNACIWCVTIT
jgi:hypothetical protein